MTTFRKMILSAATAAAALAAGSAASAQDYGRGFGPGSGSGERGYSRIAYGQGGFARESLRERIGRLERRIDFADRSGRLRPEQAFRLRDELRDVRRDAWRSGRDGVSRWEAGRIEARLDRLDDQVRFLSDRRDDFRRW